jgi:Leucine-rich repeat (LRR) protein
MSKQRKTEVKDNNISSKLLGANLNDINIEKFRDLSQLRREKYDLGGKITVPMLKTLTNKFSPEVIFTVTLPGQGLASIDALADCTNLMVLNLAKNGIENIAPLKTLVRLRIVDLSENCLASVEALNGCG